MRKLTVQVAVHREQGSYWAEVEEIPGAITEARTLDELLICLTEAISIQLDHSMRMDDAADTQERSGEAQARFLTRIVGMSLEVERDVRTDIADQISEAPTGRNRQSHRDDWPSDGRDPRRSSR